MDYFNEFSTISKNLLKIRHEAEMADNTTEERRNELLEELKEPVNTENDTEEVYSEIEHYMYKRKWNRLPDIHKINRIEDFCKRTKSKNLKRFKDMVYKKMINKQCDIDYDDAKGELVSIRLKTKKTK